jgi:hypothetical protein
MVKNYIPYVIENLVSMCILLQNRRNKTSSKEIDTGDTEMIHAYSSVKSSDSMYDCQTFLS